MSDISLETVTGKLNRVGYESFLQALRRAKTSGNRNMEIAHWLVPLLQSDRNDVAITFDHFKISKAIVASDVDRAVESLKRNETEMPGISNAVLDMLDRGWHYATLFFGEAQIRTGHLLFAAMKSPELRRAMLALSQEFKKIAVDQIGAEHRTMWKRSDEENLQPMDGSGLAAPQAGGAEGGKSERGQTALGRFANDLTETARSGEMDPILGRDDEIRKCIDVLMRRRQNNPILTGEAGVGKTAVVEGLAQRIAADQVPPPLRGVRLLSLDIGLMQAGASMKGEFEQRLRSVIDEVQSSPTPIILFIDEAHTLIGAGGAAGTGDAANLLKPALARGTLRTIAATTWSEYRQHIEKDPALTRRFQPVHVGEPDAPTCAIMLRGLVAPMEKHHKVRISDAAIVAAVTMSQRYIPARQLPDKAVSLLDTASARVAISQNSTPAAIEDLEARMAALETERKALGAEKDLGEKNDDRLSEIEEQIVDVGQKLDALRVSWEAEGALVAEIHKLREDLKAEGADEEAVRTQLLAKTDKLSAIEAERRTIYAHVDAQAVAAVVSDWTGIPVGSMVKDEIETIINLAAGLNKRVVGQKHGLDMIARRIETNKAQLDNPGKPTGVFMLCGPSGVGKTETALTLAEALYGGEQNLITINMSEFQEAHTVSTLKGAPPGYVGYGEGGRLTEAVRRRPYSVVLLDEVEKAHPDVHELFFQVFDKGIMEDGTGRRIDFKNTLIILTSNVGTDLITQLAQDPNFASDPEGLALALKPELLKVFPPALLGRLVVIPYLPLSPSMLAGITRLQLSRIERRMAENHKSAFIYDDEVVDKIVSLCNDPASGGRMIDNVITNSILPNLSRSILNSQLSKGTFSKAIVRMQDGQFACSIE